MGDGRRTATAGRRFTCLNRPRAVDPVPIRHRLLPARHTEKDGHSKI